MEGEDKELNSQNQKQGTSPVKFKCNRMPEKAEETAPPEKEDHCCKECGKIFSSGKALGGHLSAFHVQSKKDYTFNKLNFSGEKGCNSLGSQARKCCVVCGREFASSKSLLGHMRSHLESQWRGMDPPPAESSDDGDCYGSSPSSEVAAPPKPLADVASSLSGWCIKAKRGRPEIFKSPPAAADSDVTEAAERLLKFAENHAAKQDNEIEDVGSSSLLTDDHQSKKPKKESAINVAEEKLTEEEEEAESKAEPETAFQENNEASSTKQNYVCSTCNRSFPTHQALGGHKSSHNKLKIDIIDTIDDAPYGNNKYNNGSRKQSGSYKCKVCDMSFSSRQALGKHKSSHKKEGTEKNETVQQDFEIDLNKLPEELN